MFTKQSKLRYRTISAMLFFTIILLSSNHTNGFQGAVQFDVSSLHPAIVDIVDNAPAQRISIIVQKADQTDAAFDMVMTLGGTITQDLHIINAFVAELPAQAVATLAASGTVRWVSLDAPIINSNDGNGGEAAPLVNYYLDTMNVKDVWAMGLDGSGIGVAVIDSGISEKDDFLTVAGDKRIVANVLFNSSTSKKHDLYGHGTHVAGIIGGRGDNLSGLYRGVAPAVDLINLKVSDDTGMAYESDTVAAMQWVLDNKELYNIRVVNLSINAATETSYHNSPMAAAAEILWFNEIVVVASSGNWHGSDSDNPIFSAPANDPFLITVGASDENGTSDRNDDTLYHATAFATTQDGFFKPEILAPGRNIISALSKKSNWDNDYPDHVVDTSYFRASGTSMAAPMVAGAVALLLQDEPTLNPDQVKYRLMNASSTLTDNDSETVYPYLDVYAVVTGHSTESANSGIEASQLLWSGSEPVTWSSVNWSSVNWSSVNWSSVNWSSVNWSSVNLDD